MELTLALTIATLLGGVAAIWFFWDKVVAVVRGEPTVNDHDVELYEKYKALFVDNGVAEFYRQHNFLASFRENYWVPLSHYVDNWENVEHEFVDTRLQKKHRKAYEAAEKLGVAISKYTVSIGDGTFRSVKPDHVPKPIPESIKKEAKEINALKPAFAKAHRDFIRLANKKLRKRTS